MAGDDSQARLCKRTLGVKPDEGVEGKEFGSRRGRSPPMSDASCPLGLGFCIFLLRKLEEARVGQIGHFCKHQQVVAPEALRALPLIAVLVEASPSITRSTWAMIGSS